MPFTIMAKQYKRHQLIKRFNSEVLTTIKVDNDTQLISSKQELMTIQKQALIRRLELQDYKVIADDVYRKLIKS